MKKPAFITQLLASVAAIVAVSCSSPLAPAMTGTADDSSEARALSATFSVSSHVYDKGAFNRNYTNYNTAYTDKTDDANVDTGAWIVIKLTSPVNPACLPTSLDNTAAYPVLVTRSRDGKPVLGRFQLRNGNMDLVFRPAQRHWLEPLSGSEGTKTSWQGIKPNTAYTVSVSKLSDTGGRPLAVGAANSWSFSTMDVDWGLYFMSKKQADGFVYTEKYVPGRDNLYFSPSAKTMVYTHGYEKNATINDYRRENLLYFITKGTGTIPLGFDTLQYIIDDGWNFGFFFWDQFADEPDEVKYIEAKMWKAANGIKGMRYRVQTTPGSGEYRTANQPVRSLGEELYNVYVSALAGNTATKRVIGHSNGAQLISHLARRISDSVTAGTIPSSYLPSRMALLEGFWSKDTKAYFNGILGWTKSMYNGEAVRSIVTTLKSRHPTMAIEQEKDQNNMCGDSWMSIGDANYELRKLTFVRYFYPDFIGSSATADTGDRHCYARLYYFWTYSPQITASIEAAGGFTSRSADASINANMNSSTRLYSFKQTAGTGSADPSDDRYSRVSLANYK